MVRGSRGGEAAGAAQDGISSLEGSLGLYSKQLACESSVLKSPPFLP